MKSLGGSDSRPSLHVVLVEPEIPPNTGSIARLCGATNSVLHLIHPLGFKTDDKHLRRAGLDYWPSVTVRHHSSLKTFMIEHAEGNFFYFSTRGKYIYTEANFTPGCFLVFGKETGGLPRSLLKTNIERSFYLPIWGKVRSLNLSNAAGIVLYEAYRKLGIWE
ncbi:MAG: tRNA (uridine(34)/cytosine(34)/5-carboxymethylaminomethyluridine(34)-2'-O)-methyltransferase TrmL [Deltaproteobacteria bacterium]|nr:MAG: tRNA (uridine(34)/cytosine(34)/5-carboxymethylaminomethyluridine(34)-2'-O)-methyltransferase TrmL [Deltaproteobacteria bacterium]